MKEKKLTIALFLYSLFACNLIYAVGDSSYRSPDIEDALIYELINEENVLYACIPSVRWDKFKYTEESFDKILYVASGFFGDKESFGCLPPSEFKDEALRVTRIPVTSAYHIMSWSKTMKIYEEKPNHSTDPNDNVDYFSCIHDELYHSKKYKKVIKMIHTRMKLSQGHYGCKGQKSPY